ncbi:MAG TPA: hypothetical protein VIL65_10810 [Beijerinckiaceae bacterium]|jgi:hypothetical protein
MAGRLATLLRETFGRRKAEPAALAQVKAWAVTAIPGAAFTVNEIVCPDPACPGYETVILVMAPGQPTRAAKIPKLVDEVTEQDVRAALVPDGG